MHLTDPEHPSPADKARSPRTNDLDMAMADWIDSRARLLVTEAQQHIPAILSWATAPRNAGLLEIALTGAMLAVYDVDVTLPAWGQEHSSLARAGALAQEALLLLAQAWARERAIDECRERFLS